MKTQHGSRLPAPVVATSLMFSSQYPLKDPEPRIIPVNVLLPERQLPRNMERLPGTQGHLGPQSAQGAVMHWMGWCRLLNFQEFCQSTVKHGHY